MASAGAVIFLMTAAAVLMGYQLSYTGRIYPGVSVAGIDLSGLSSQEAEALIAARVTYPQTGLIALTDKQGIWAKTPGDTGLYLNAPASAQAAYSIGRAGWPWTRLYDQLRAWQYGVSLPPHLIFDGRIAQLILQRIADELNQPTQEAFLAINGLDVLVRPGQVGRTLDVWATSMLLGSQLTLLQDGEVPLLVYEDPPIILDVSAQAEIARQILSAPLTLTIPNSTPQDPGPWTIDQAALADMLLVERVEQGGQQSYQVRLDSDRLRVMLNGIAPGLMLSAKNARFIFNDETRQLDLISNATIGRTLNVEASVAQIQSNLSQGNHTVDLVFDLENPTVTDNATSQSLGVTQLVSAQTTYFYGSSAGRIQNIQTAAAQFHGLFVAPGAVFSMVENIGDISLDSGYAESLIIYGDRTIAGVGGGVCQVSTTLFRTVFFGGYPVEERYSHAYRVYYYELAQSGAKDIRMAGLDATVYAPVVDFKFKNDTPYWLLMETYVNPTARSITWKFYSTSDGRRVEWQTSGLRNRVEPPEPIYEINEDFRPGQIEQVDWAVEGADVVITRTVYIGNQIYFTDEFKTHYKPWAMVCQYGSGTKNYPPKEKFRDPDSCT